MSQPGPGPVGYIFHVPSGKQIHPLNGAYDPPEGFKIVVYNDLAGPGRLQFRFVPQDGDLGYIEHVSSGKILYPQGGSASVGTPLILRTERDPAGFFKFQQSQERIAHVSGLLWCPADGSTNPPDNTFCILSNDNTDATKFKFCDRSGKVLNCMREK